MNIPLRSGAWLAVLAWWVVCSAGAVDHAAAVDDDVAVIVNRTNPVASLSMAELREIYLAGRQHWSDGKRITLAVRQPGDPERDAMLRVICQMTEGNFTRHFLHAIFAGQVPSAPKTLTTATGVKRFVFNVPTAIGYVRGSDLDDSVKALRIDGRAPGDPGYAITLRAGLATAASGALP